MSMRRRCLVVLLALAGMVAASVQAGPLIALRESMTSSEAYRMGAGVLSQNRNIEIPPCGRSEFMFTRVVAYPRPLLTAGLPGEFDASLGRWYVLVPLGQPELGGSEAGVQLFAYGNGYETVDVAIDPGQSVLESLSTAYPSIEVPVVIVEGSGTVAHEFIVHLSGRCKRPFVTTVPSNTD